MDIADARAIRTIALEKCDRPAGRDLGDRMRGIAITRAAAPPLVKAIVPVTGWARLVAVEAVA
jgi:hypothetical protein